MENAKHTPGPWKADGYIVSGDWHCSAAIARVISGPRAFDDARLIAAAPELLEALEGLCGLAELRPGHLQDYKSAVAAARAAIAKATGGK